MRIRGVRGPGGFIPAFGGPPFRGHNPKIVPAYKYPRNYFASFKMPAPKTYYKRSPSISMLKRKGNVFGGKGLPRIAATKIQALFRGRRLRKFIYNK